MTTDRAPHELDEAGLRAFEAALHQREEVVGLRENLLDAQAAYQQERADLLDVQLQDGREVNAQLVLGALRLQELADEAEQINLRKDEFIAMLSHELRNPLAPMRNAIELLGQLSESERLRWIHEVLHRQVRQLSRLLDDLLDAGRVRSGKVVLKKELVESRVLIDNAVESCLPLLESRGQHFTLDWPAGAHFMFSDPVRLTQVFANLLNNAGKYTQEGGAITLRGRRIGNVLVVCVLDNGLGMSAAALPRIFDLFAQEDEALAHAQGGLGIGLAVVRELVHLHGGSVEASSAGLGLGSEFRVRLPLIDALALSLAPIAATPAPASIQTVPLLIVAIDDNVDANDSLAALLGAMGHHVEVAYDGHAGLALALALRPQVVLCDLGLPGLDGLQVARQLRAQMSDPRPLLVAMTGYGRSADLERSRAAGFDEHLVKPVEPDVLMALLACEAARLSAQPPTLPH